METRIFIDVLELVLSILGIVIPLCVVICEHYSKKRKQLVEQVIAYYCLQEEAIKWIQEFNPNLKEKNVKEELRRRAQVNKKNMRKSYPKMAIKEAEKYL